MEDRYDVVIMGGGPAGATLGAVLANRTDLRVALFEKEVFPREHIGESFAHPLVPALEESGALPRVLASDCWVKKFGGVYNWDVEKPSVAFFDHAAWQDDGVYRWTMHTNRSEFDHILLNHARSCGVEVFEGSAVSRYEPNGDSGLVRLGDGREVRSGYFVDASGRHNNVAVRKKRAWLSDFKNIAIWQHFLHCGRTQTLDYDWNIFAKDDLSPIGCFAFQDGWCWFIPVPKVIKGRRVMTHSVGIVTNPAVLKEPGRDFTDQKTFLQTVREIPFLQDLLHNATPIADDMLTATNYSRVSDEFANIEERYLLVGDAAFFVDPLFSSGVSVATTQALAAGLLLQATTDPDLPEIHKRDLWHDYNTKWHATAETFALMIDQWYYAIAKNNPGSIYWNTRGSGIDLNIREETFDALLNTSFQPTLLEILTHGSRRIEDLDAAGPFLAASALAEPVDLTEDAVLTLAPGVALRESVTLMVPGFKAIYPPAPFTLPAPVKTGIAHYWRNPLEHGSSAPAPLRSPMPCHRIYFTGDPSGTSIDGDAQRDGIVELWELLSAGPAKYGDIVHRLSEPQRRLVKRMCVNGMLLLSSAVETRVAESPTSVGD